MFFVVVEFKMKYIHSKVNFFKIHWANTFYWGNPFRVRDIVQRKNPFYIKDDLKGNLSYLFGASLCLLLLVCRCLSLSSPTCHWALVHGGIILCLRGSASFLLAGSILLGAAILHRVLRLRRKLLYQWGLGHLEDTVTVYANLDLDLWTLTLSRREDAVYLEATYKKQGIIIIMIICLVYPG